jgi:excisionase family DNA binding protein
MIVALHNPPSFLTLKRQAARLVISQKEKLAMTVTSASYSERLDDLQLYELRDAMRMLRLSKTVIYELIRSGRLRSVKQGRARRIPAAAIRDYIALLEREAVQ